MHHNAIADGAMWDAASTSHDEVEHRGQVVRATVALAGTWPFLAAALSPEGFEQRLALMAEQIEARVPPDVREEVVAGLRDKYAAMRQEALATTAMLRTAARTIHPEDSQTPLPAAYVHVHKHGSGEDEYHQVDFVGGPAFLQTIGHKPARDDALQMAREYGLPHGLPIYENGRYVEGKRLQPGEEFLDAKTGTWVPASRLRRTAHQSWTAGGTALSPFAGIADEGARARREANWGDSHQPRQATSYQPDPDAAQRYHYDYPQPNLAQGGQPTAPDSGSMNVNQQAGMSSIDTDGFPLDVAQGEGAAGYAKIQEQITPGPWQVTPGTEWPTRQNAGHPGEQVFARRRTASDSTKWIGQFKVKGGSAYYDTHALSSSDAEDFGCPGSTHMLVGNHGHMIGSITQHPASRGEVSIPGWSSRKGVLSSFTSPALDNNEGGVLHGHLTTDGQGQQSRNRPSPKTSSRRTAGEGIAPTPGPNPNYFSQGTQGIAGPPTFPENPSGDIEPKTDNRVDDFYGDVPPQQSQGSDEGLVDGTGYSRQASLTLYPVQGGVEARMTHGRDDFTVGRWQHTAAATRDLDPWVKRYEQLHGVAVAKQIEGRAPNFSEGAGERTLRQADYRPDPDDRPSRAEAAEQEQWDQAARSRPDARTDEEKSQFDQRWGLDRPTWDRKQASTDGKIVGVCDHCSRQVRYHTEKGGHLQHLHNGSPKCSDGKSATAMIVREGSVEYRLPLPRQAAVMENPTATNPTGQGADPYRAQTDFQGFEKQRPRQKLDDMHPNTPATAPVPIPTGRNINTPFPADSRDKDDEDSDDDEGDDDQDEKD